VLSTYRVCMCQSAYQELQCRVIGMCLPARPCLKCSDACVCVCVLAGDTSVDKYVFLCRPLMTGMCNLE